MILQGDARHIPLANESVQCVVTSPPYWGLRDYGIGEAGIGLEPTPELYVEHAVEVFREVRRVLRKDGTCWVNLGDSYASDPKKGGSGTYNGRNGYGEGYARNQMANSGFRGVSSSQGQGTLKAKDLCGIPWRVAFALQADGWWLRSDIIWSKPNPMPESVTDRPTKAHEYIFLLSKSESYFYDGDAIREPAIRGFQNNNFRGEKYINNQSFTPTDVYNQNRSDMFYTEGNRNKRTVWTVATQPYPDAHFATFPEDLIKPCILAGTSQRGACSECGAPWERVVEKSGGTIGKSWHDHSNDAVDGNSRIDYGSLATAGDIPYTVKTLGWQPTCHCRNYSGLKASAIRPCIVLDPFAGSGTTVKVAQDLGRIGIGLDLKPDYLKMAKHRAAQMGLAV